MRPVTLKVAHIAAGLWRHTGGPSEVIPNLCLAQAKLGMDVTLFSTDGDNAEKLYDLIDHGSVKVVLVGKVDPIVRYSPRWIDEVVCRGEFHIIHNHGHWLYPNWVSQKISRRMKTPFVTTPHGTLVSGMLAKSAIKKRIAWSLFDNRLIASASRIHALSEAERIGMSAKLGVHLDRCVVIPNGVSIPKLKPTHKANDNNQTLLFLSRLAPIKGIVELVEAWLSIHQSVPKWNLKLVGPAEIDVASALKKLVTPESRIEVLGPAYGEDRWNHFVRANAFVLPSRGEGLPTALLEAASFALPVLTTKDANFPELNAWGGSLLTTLEPNALAADLKSFLTQGSGELVEMGIRGRALIEQRYTWPQIALQWLKTYQDVQEEHRKLRY